MSSIAKVIVEIALNKEFDYRIPDEIAHQIVPGAQVEVPFGKRFARGFVVALARTSERVELKSIRRRIGTKPLVEPTLLDLAKWMGDYYMAPIEHAVRAVLPSAVRKKGAGFKERLFVVLEEKAFDERSVAELKKSASRRAEVLEVLVREREMFLQDLARAARTTAPTIRKLEHDGFVRIHARAQPRNPLARHTLLPTQPLSLMTEQAHALEMCKQSMDSMNPPVLLLFGVTGSGKTEVYLQAIQYAIAKKRGAIVLVPEIALTPQAVDRFRSRFGDRVAVLHSSLSSGERHDEWHRIHDGHASIVIGARSALFAPVHNLGLIVVDEEHEPTYKQEESPRYHARDVAVMRGHIERCAVVLGSATPSMESMHNVRKGKYGMAMLSHRVDYCRMPVVKIVDQRHERQREGRLNVLSRDLLDGMRDRLNRKEQCILFLNRRGFSTSLSCPRCGYTSECENCSVTMIYHKNRPMLCCHICGDRKKVPLVCPNPECKDPDFRFGGIGTQKVEEIVATIFSKYVVARMDADTTSQRGSHRRILDAFRVGDIDVLIGTQMIAKGLHFPNVTLVGVINADSSLHLADFRAGERTFQLLTQVAGRAGRGDVMGEVFVQTFTPFHPAVKFARTLDYDGYYEEEIEYRKELSYPPFAHLVCVTLAGELEPRVEATCGQLVSALKSRLSPTVICSSGCPAPLARAKKKYRYQIIMRAPMTRSMTQPLRKILKGFEMPKGLTCSVDVDAISLL